MKKAIALIVILLVAAIVALQLPPVQKGLLNQLGKHIAAETVKARLPFWIEMENVVVKTDDFEAKLSHVYMLVNPLKLIIGKLHILKLTIDQAEVITHATKRGGGALPDIDAFSITHLQLNTLPNIELKGSIDQDGLHFSATHEMFGLRGTLFDETFDGEGSIQGETFSLDYCNHKLKAERGDETLTATVTWDEKALHITDVALTSPLGTLHGQGAYLFAKKEYSGSGTLILPNLSKIDSRLTGEATGTLLLGKEGVIVDLCSQNLIWDSLYSLPTLSAQLLWKPGDPLTVYLYSQEVAINDPSYEVFPDLTIELVGTVADETLTFRGKLAGFTETPFVLHGAIPVSKIGLNMEAPFHLSLLGKGCIDPLLAFLENASLIAHGSIDLNLELNGTLNAPSLSGHLHVIDGYVESLATGALYRDISIKMEGQGDTLLIRELSLHDAERGDLVGSGSLLCDVAQHFPFELTIDASSFTFFALDTFTGQCNAHLALRGSMEELLIRGKAELISGNIHIPNRVPSTVPVIDVTYINPIEPALPPTRKKMIPVEWDLAIDAKDHLVIEGRGLVSEWKGSMRLTGDHNDLHYQGDLKLVQGRFSTVGRTFYLTTGKIHFDGLSPQNIQVDVAGDLALSRLTVTLHVRGNLDETYLTFTSNPPMSTNQILSWILFNQDVNELTPFQACRLANIMVALSGKYEGPKVIDGIKESLGIDVFDITQCDIDSQDFSFQVGKYISQGTFVGINKSLSGDADSITIQTRLFRDFFLEGDYGGSLNTLTPNGGKIVFKWYKSY